MASRIVLASGNAGKLREFRTLLAGSGFDVVPQSDFTVPDADETGLTFVENAILKARNACRHTGLPALADDSGLEVDHLKGAPGIRSARFAGPDAGDADNVAKLLRHLEGVSDTQRSARFQCLLVYLRHVDDPTPLICQGTWEGRITAAPAGAGGFGYDPVFWVPTLDCTAAELPREEKNRISHRGQAMALLLDRLRATSIPC